MKVSRVLGTGSMSYKGYIPPAPEGWDPRKTVVAVVVFGARGFDDVQEGDLCSFRSANLNILHQAAGRFDEGWIMSGNANERHDGKGRRMTAENFRGIVDTVYVIRQPTESL